MMRPFSPAAYRQITRPLIRADGSFDRKKIFENGRRRFDQSRRLGGKPITWSKALFEAWQLAHRQIDLARAFDAARTSRGRALTSPRRNIIPLAA